jgi:hypothetical protein
MLFPFMGDGENTPLWLAVIELVIASFVFIAIIILMKTYYT